MVRLRLLQIGLAICLMASLLTASPAACTCPHPPEAETSDECKAHHEETGNVDTTDAGITADDTCVCTVDQRSPSVASKSESKDLDSKDGIANAHQLTQDLEFVAVYAYQQPTPLSAHSLSYSSTLKSLLPSRAPPRL